MGPAIPEIRVNKVPFMPSNAKSVQKEKTDSGKVSEKDGYFSKLINASSKIEIQILTAITLLAAFLRIYQLGAESLWLDEATTYMVASNSFFQVLEVTSNDVHPPLYYILVHFFLLLGNSEIILRLPSMIMGILSVPVLYFITARMFSLKEGLVSSFLLSVSMVHIYYSQEARMYSMLLFLSLCSMYFFYLATEDNKKVYWVLFSFFTVLTIYTHYFGFFIFPIEILFYLVTQLSFTGNGKSKLPFAIKDVLNFKMFTASALAVGILIIPRIQVFFEQAASRVGGEVTWGIGPSQLLPVLLSDFSTFSESPSVVFMLLFITGIIVTVLQKRRQSLLLSLWLVLPLLVSFYLAAVMPFQPRYLIFLLPAFLIFVSRGITIIPYLFISDTGNSEKKKKNETGNAELKRSIMIVVIVLVVFLGSIGSLIGYYTTVQKNDWRQVSSTLESATQQGDVIVALPVYMSKPMLYYYDNSSDETYVTGVGYTQEGLEAIVNDTAPNRVFFILTGDINAANPEGTALAWLQNNTNVVAVINGVYILTPMN